MPKKSYVAAVVALFLLMGSRSVLAQENMVYEKIGFYKLAITSQGAELLHVKAVPGRLKQPRKTSKPQGPYFFTVTSSTGDALWQEDIGDPLNEPVEYIDEAGNLAIKTVHRDTVVVYLRSRITLTGGRLNLYHLDNATPGNASKAPRLVESFNISID